MDTTYVPAAQYLRMSTDHQQYSLDNQSDAIAQYAMQHGFQIVKTYSDAAKSGLRLKNRAGLKQLLKDVVIGQKFRAVLVYDVSRWGRFQDHDEAAHYEYVCKSAGVPVHYCAEMFGIEGGALGWLLKSLKRTMAGEYSRELSVKVKTGLVRLAKLGYKLGGNTPYGLRRQLLNEKGKPKQLLEFGERKSIMEERVTLVPGPVQEVSVVRRIFWEFANEHQSIISIAKRLNEEHVPFLRGTTWKWCSLRGLLQDPRYIGMHVWGRSTSLLSTPKKQLPISDWIIYPNAFEPIISQELFIRAQHVFANFTIRLTDEDMIERLRRVHAQHGKLNTRIIDQSRLCPSITAYYRRFGGLLNVYTRLGYDAPKQRAHHSRRTTEYIFRAAFLKTVLDAFPNQFQEVRKNNRFRPLLRYRRTGLLLSLVFSRYSPNALDPKWIIETPDARTGHAALLVSLDSEGKVELLWIFRRIPAIHRHMRIREGDEFLKAGRHVECISGLVDAIRSLSGKD
jgi:DNA invertase Pin-like site-specific DNA recombinase